MFHFELEKSWFVHLDSWVWLRGPYFASYFFLIWEQSFILHHQPPGEVLDFHPESSISTFPSRWVLEPSRHFRRKPQRMKSKNIYLQSLRNPNTWQKANRSPCLCAWLIKWFLINLFNMFKVWGENTSRASPWNNCKGDGGGGMYLKEAFLTVPHPITQRPPTILVSAWLFS